MRPVWCQRLLRSILCAKRVYIVSCNCCVVTSLAYPLFPYVSGATNHIWPPLSLNLMRGEGEEEELKWTEVRNGFCLGSFAWLRGGEKERKRELRVESWELIHKIPPNFIGRDVTRKTKPEENYSQNQKDFWLFEPDALPLTVCNFWRKKTYRC